MKRFKYVSILLVGVIARKYPRSRRETKDRLEGKCVSNISTHTQGLSEFGREIGRVYFARGSIFADSRAMQFSGPGFKSMPPDDLPEAEKRQRATKNDASLLSIDQFRIAFSTASRWPDISV